MSTRLVLPEAELHEHDEPEWGVVRCACGRLYLKLGSLRLEFTPEQFQNLHILVRDAARHFGLETSEPSGHPVPTAH